MGDLIYPVRRKFDDALAQRLASEKVFLGVPWGSNGRYRPGDMVSVKKKTLTERYSSMPPKAFLSMGAFSYGSPKLPENTIVGRYCSLGHNIHAMGSQHPIDRISTHPFTYRPYFSEPIEQEFGLKFPQTKHVQSNAPIVIGNDVWIGSDVLIKRGVRIGDGAIVAARSIVTKDVQPYEIVGGTPAKRIRLRFEEALISDLQAVQWWQYLCTDFADVDASDVPRFVTKIAARVASGQLTKWEPGYVDIGELISAA